MAGAFGTLITSNVKTWMSGKGFLLVCMAALIPLILSVSWVGTHKADVAPVGVTWEPASPINGEPVNFTAVIQNKGRFAVGAFNATIIVGPTDVVGGVRQIETRGQNSTRINGLAPGESATIHMRWTPSPFVQIGQRPDIGTFEVLVDADAQDEIGEIDEYNNRHQSNIQIHLGTIPDSQVPLPFTTLTGNPNATARVDVGVRNVTWSPPDVFPNETLTLSAEFHNFGTTAVTNATATLRVVKDVSTAALNETVDTLNLAPGESRNFTLVWTVPPQANEFQPELYRAEAYVRVGDNANDTAAENNLESKAFILDRKIIFPEPPPRATIRGYYISIVRQLLLPLLLPVIGLYYAAGVLSDERDRGNLVYLLTRPVNRTALPLARFLVSFVVAGIAITIGVLGSFLLILGLPQGESSYLFAPLALVLVALLAYGAVFTLIGVTFARPYLVGIGFIGWEWLIQVGRQILVNDRPVVAPWVQNLTVFKWLEVLAKDWNVDKPLVWLPTSGPAMEALRNLLIATLALIALAAYVARRREFPE
jgi:ABC-2 family transporter/CARDB protein